MRTEDILRTYQSYSLAKISALSKQQLIAQYAQCEKLEQLNQQLESSNETNRKLLDNQIRELKRQEKLRYYKTLAFNLNHSLQTIESQENKNFKIFLGSNFLKPIGVLANDATSNLEEITDKEYASSIASRALALLADKDSDFVEILLIVALILLVSAIFNYINLTVAQAGKRAKEMATRCLLGESSVGITLRYIRESFLMTICCFLFGCLIAYLVRHLFNEVLHADITILPDFVSIGSAILALMVVSVICGSVPAVLGGRYLLLVCIVAYATSGRMISLLNRSSSKSQPVAKIV